MSKILIYSLEDPRNGLIRYVGQTIKTLEERLYQHLQVDDKTNSHKSQWIKQLLKLNLKPVISLIEEVEEKDWRNAEKYWIAQLKAWCFDLTNSTEGGDFGNTWKYNNHKRSYK